MVDYGVGYYGVYKREKGLTESECGVLTEVEGLTCVFR